MVVDVPSGSFPDAGPKVFCGPIRVLFSSSMLLSLIFCHAQACLSGFLSDFRILSRPVWGGAI